MVVKMGDYDITDVILITAPLAVVGILIYMLFKSQSGIKNYQFVRDENGRIIEITEITR